MGEFGLGTPRDGLDSGAGDSIPGEGAAQAQDGSAERAVLAVDPAMSLDSATAPDSAIFETPTARESEARGGAHPRAEDGAFAALDLGTNNCRLLIVRAGAGSGSFQVIDAFSRIVRLGEGLSQSGELSAAAMDRAIEALRICAAKLGRRRLTAWRAVATEACRRAANGADFIRRVQRETGIALEIVSAAEEAELAFTGCLPLLESPRDAERGFALVFDIGGGSTELGWIGLEAGRPPRILAWHSVPLGVVTLTEEFGSEVAEGGDPHLFYEGLVERVALALSPFARAVGGARSPGRDGAPLQMIGTSGTVTTLAGIALGLKRYERSVVDGAYLRFADIRRITRDIASRDCRGRARFPCIGPDRADLVLSGCAVLEAICRYWPVGRLRVADRGVREGILTALMNGRRWPAPRVRS